MLKKGRNGIWMSDLLLPTKGIFHGFSSRGMGDARKPKVRQAILVSFGVSSQYLISAEQVHGGEVAGVTPAHAERMISSVDGLVTKKNHPVSLGLGVHVADCVPILLADEKAEVVAAVHAGWKGTLANIAGKAVNKMVELGAKPSRILACLGPHIGMCHYNVPSERAEKFLDAFGGEPKVASEFDGAWRLDLGWANYRQLVDTGITSDHIDAPPICTACQIGEFFSYRKDKNETFGEILGLIGFADL